jgi:peptidoglycan/xylan/chitin deacetylase (PgdA/CDA1 family)
MDLPRGEQSAAVAARVFRGTTSDVPELMTWDQVAELAAWGHAIGGHGMNHIRLAGLDPNRLEHEIAGARRGLSERLKRSAEWFAFPFGDIASVDRAALHVIARHFRFCRSGVRGINRAGTPPMAILAEHVDLDAPFAYQRTALEGGLDFRHAAARMRLAGMTRN